jgi:pimeloyl-ACP methyl ester carboxylesterase
MKTQFVSINGIRLAYQDVGEGERPLVLVHGFTGYRHDFADHLEALAALGRTVVYDHRGHGESANTGDAASYSFAQLANDLSDFLDALRIERCDLLGHSMGGMVALRFALDRPERVASLLLMDTAARAPDGTTRELFAAGVAIARSKGMVELAQLMQARGADDPNRPEASRNYEARVGSDQYWLRHRQRLEAMDPEAFAALGVELAEQIPVTDRLSGIGCPTTVVVGDQDKPFLRPAAELVEHVPGAAHVVVADAAHSPQLENPEVWFTAIRDHLARARRS